MKTQTRVSYLVFFIHSVYNKTLCYLYNEVSASEVGNGARQSRAAPHKAKEQRTLGVGELLHHFPEPLNQRCRRINTLVRRDRLEQIQRNVWTAAYLHCIHTCTHISI